jgi:hypothetical protein
VTAVHADCVVEIHGGPTVLAFKTFHEFRATTIREAGVSSPLRPT